MIDSRRGRHPLSQPVAASLDNPLYYLENFDTVVSWVAHLHGDLLTPQERELLVGLSSLGKAPRALLARLVMRSGSLFRLSRLKYPELGVTDAVNTLAAAGWVVTDPPLDFAGFCRLFTLAELRQALAGPLAAAGLSPGVTKKQLTEALAPRLPAAQPLRDWWPEAPDAVLALQHMALFERLRLMFFGNLRQGWSDFVLAELGIYRYEPVRLTAESRAFGSRAEVDAYLHLHGCREALDNGETPQAIWQLVTKDVAPNRWLESRRGRLLFELGRQAERGGDRELALMAWAMSGHREGRLRQLRLLERMGRLDEAWQLVREARRAPRNAAETEGLLRLEARLAKKLGQPVPVAPQPHQPKEYPLTLAQPAHGTVEAAVVKSWQDDAAPVFYVENTLFNSLFGLLCWPALFAPLPGAFFHPFQQGPADLFREDFVARRREQFDACLAQLADGRYRETIRQAWRDKQGVANPLVTWPVLSAELLELALACLPAEHLAAVFRRMLEDLKAHTSGLPDLVRFYPATRAYELVEVKGPGDRLQDHQRRWLAFFAGQGMPAAVCYVRWQEPGAS